MLHRDGANRPISSLYRPAPRCGASNRTASPAETKWQKARPPASISPQQSGLSLFQRVKGALRTIRARCQRQPKPTNGPKPIKGEPRRAFPGGKRDSPVRPLGDSTAGLPRSQSARRLACNWRQFPPMPAVRCDAQRPEGRFGLPTVASEPVSEPLSVGVPSASAGSPGSANRSGTAPSAGWSAVASGSIRGAGVS